MKTRYKYIEFVSHPDIPDIWVCRNRRYKTILGGTERYAKWSQHSFSADVASVFSSDCLEDIADFLKQLNAVSR